MASPQYSYAPQEPAPIHSSADQDHYETSRTPSPLPPPSTQYVPPYATPSPRRAEGAPYNPYAAQEPYNPTAYNPNTLAPQYGGLEAESVRDGGRTPSPTPSETEALEEKKMMNWKKTLSLERKNWPRLAIITFFLVLVILFSVFQNQIIKALQPAANWAHRTKGGFLIPLALLFILSFPPLFGAEFIAILCGVVWGAGYGFLIVLAGQFFGELGNYFAFKYLCMARSQKLQKNSIKYAALARSVQEGGLIVAVVARYSIIPGHLITALFATCGMKLWVFVVSTLLSMPQNFVNVYIGSEFELEEEGKSTTASKVANYITIAVTVVVTIAAGRYIDALNNKHKPAIVYERRKARQFAASSTAFDSSTARLYVPPAEEIEMPARGHTPNQYSV
ncbi:hypothetical protein HWV62_16544 [Athelia sp. TMB]|nr:hypothetical protein HWV62_16544 [Athelia sp. TMB]